MSWVVNGRKKEGDSAVELTLALLASSLGVNGISAVAARASRPVYLSRLNQTVIAPPIGDHAGRPSTAVRALLFFLSSLTSPLQNQKPRPGGHPSLFLVYNLRSTF